ncbi:hypothetical protein ACC697_04370 [Rhizobium ruizarguesonis]|uniref:hypothetical protein n=1 Tax=Rhizobium ruizarguesonis TaxID=2081791 RepID=UPI001639F15C|nr:hypothetical protein [Rhizobium ruizarguesonis]MBC2804840.1 hypothetical protein [Rhizobium ruizarguesonis]
MSNRKSEGTTFLWDKPLTSQEVMKLSPSDKRERTEASFRRKMELLKRIATDPGLHAKIDPKLYKSRAALRKWTDIDLKLWPWSDPKVDGRPTHSSAYTEALEAIDKLKGGAKSSLKQQLAAKDVIIASLERQILSLMEQLDRVTRDADKPSPR